MKKILLITSVILAVCLLVILLKPWPIFDRIDSAGNLADFGMFHFLDPGNKAGTYAVYEVDLEKMPPDMLLTDALKIALENLKNKCDSLHGPRITLNNKRQMVVYLQGIKDPTGLEKIVQSNAVLELKLSGTTLPFLTGGDIYGSEMKSNFNGTYKVWMKLSGDSGKKYPQFAGANAGRKFEAIVDGRVYLNAVLAPGFKGREGIIADNLSKDDAWDLALILRVGTKVPLKLVNTKVISPGEASLGIKL